MVSMTSSSIAIYVVLMFFLGLVLFLKHIILLLISCRMHVDHHIGSHKCTVLVEPLYCGHLGELVKCPV